MLCIYIYKSDLFAHELAISVCVYWMLGGLCSLLSPDIFFSMPVMIIRCFGLLRYFIIAYVMKSELITLPYFKHEWLMVVEMIAVYMAFFVFTYKNPKFKKAIVPHEKSEYISENKYYGISIISVFIIASIYILMNGTIIVKYFTLNTALTIVFSNGFVALIVSSFFSVLYIKTLVYIESMNINSKAIKLLGEVIISALFVNGSNLTSTSVSRWSFLISIIIAYVFLTRLHSEYKKKLTVLLVVSGSVVVLVSSLNKFQMLGAAGYNNTNEALKTLISYRNLNAYCSGPTNIVNGMDTINYIDMMKISKIEMFVSDVFNNFPLLNKFFVNVNITSPRLFNYVIYGTTQFVDQIMPLSVQFYNYFGVLFFVPEMVIVYAALDCYKKAFAEKDFIRLYYLIYLSFTFSLINNINMTVMFQNIWIQILPMYLIYKFNYRIKN